MTRDSFCSFWWCCQRHTLRETPPTFPGLTTVYCPLSSLPSFSFPCFSLYSTQSLLIPFDVLGGAEGWGYCTKVSSHQSLLFSFVGFFVCLWGFACFFVSSSHAPCYPSVGSQLAAIHSELSLFWRGSSLGCSCLKEYSCRGAPLLRVFFQPCPQQCPLLHGSFHSFSPNVSFYISCISPAPSSHISFLPFLLCFSP